MLENWLVEIYSKQFIEVESGQTLADLKQRVANDEQFIVFKSDTTWRAALLKEVIDFDGMDGVLNLITIDELSVPIVADVIATNTDESANSIEERLLQTSNAIFVIINPDDDSVEALLANTVRTTTTKRDVQFTAFHPLQVPGEGEHKIWLYAHVADALDTVTALVSEQAQDTVPRKLQSSKIKPGTRIEVFVEYDDSLLEFSTDHLTKRFDGEWERFEFEFKALPGGVGQQCKVCLSAQIADFEVASVEVIILIAEPNSVPTKELKAETRNTQRIFISYSRRDTVVVRKYYLAQICAGNDVFYDVESIRAGKHWKREIEKAIDEADFLQLFWSANSRDSDFVEKEWRHCLEIKCENDIQNCDGIIRPVFWEHPMPKVPDELAELNFRYVNLAD